MTEENWIDHVQVGLYVFICDLMKPKFVWHYVLYAVSLLLCMYSM